MKKIFLILLCASPFLVMAQDKFEITGKLPLAGSGQIVLLSYTNSAGKSTRDSTTIENGKFKLTGTTTFGNLAYLELKPLKKEVDKRKRTDFQQFFLEQGKTLVVGKDSLTSASISGTQAQRDYIEYNSKMKPLQAQYKKIVDRYYKATAAKDSIALKQITADSKPLTTKMEFTLDNFISMHPDSYYTAVLVLSNRMQIVDVDKIDPIYKSLSKRVLSSFTGQQITARYNKAKQFAVGKAIDFTLPDDKGNEFKLSSLKGKYVLVDFWASWCIPCRAENPFMLKAYKELKDKNFEIVGVSLDDKRENWLKAVATDQLPWIQVSDVKGFKTEVAVKFGISAIPQNVLLDPDGKVIAKDLRGEDLNKKIAALIK